MKRISGVWCMVALVVLGAGRAARADDKDATAVLDKAIKALGGEEKLSKPKAFFWKTKGVFSINGEDREFSAKATAQGLDHYRSEFEAEFNGEPFKAISVLDGDKGYRKFRDDSMPLEGDMLANEKRTVYLQVAPVTILPLKGKGFKVEMAPEEKVGDKPASVLKITGPDGKDFTLSFDKESGLPVKMVARVIGFGGEEYTQESTFASYKDFDGIKKATKLEAKRDGDRFIVQDVVEFKALDKVDDGTFGEPK
jgi:hypothetical protein